VALPIVMMRTINTCPHRIPEAAARAIVEGMKAAFTIHGMIGIGTMDFC
jgi:hypothetical protein